MHPAVREYVAEHLPGEYESVLEVGSRDINGGVRDLLAPEAAYIGVDLREGPGVDVVADFSAYRHPERVDVVLCLEVFEHTPEWREIIDSAHRNLKPGGTLIVTCATTRRPPHSAVNGGALPPGEHYANVAQDELNLALSRGFCQVSSEVKGTDLRACAIREDLAS